MHYMMNPDGDLFIISRIPKNTQAIEITEEEYYRLMDEEEKPNDTNAV